MDEMKMFVWVEPYPVRYGDSLLIVVAANVDAARELAASGKGYSYGLHDSGVPSVALGEPTRIVDLPCAEWHRWAE